MDGIHCAHSLLFKRKGQRLHCIIDSQTLRCKRQDRKNFVTPRLIEDATDFVLQRFRAEQRMLPGLNGCQNSQNRFCFNPDAGLCLVVERTLQSTIVKVNAHRLNRLLTYRVCGHNVEINGGIGRITDEYLQSQLERRRQACQ